MRASFCNARASDPMLGIHGRTAARANASVSLREDRVCKVRDRMHVFHTTTAGLCVAPPLFMFVWCTHNGKGSGDNYVVGKRMEAFTPTSYVFGM
jgi:hypothetical protein